MLTVNRATILGHCAVDPTYMKNQSKYCKLVVTTNEGTGDYAKANHHQISCFDEKKTEFVMSYIKKGMVVYVEGQMDKSKLDDGSYYHSIKVTQWNSTIILCTKSGESNHLPEKSKIDTAMDRAREALNNPGGKGEPDDKIPF